MTRSRQRLISASLVLLIAICAGTGLLLVRLPIEPAETRAPTPNQVFRSFTELAPSTVPALRETMSLDAPAGANGIAAITQTPDGRFLLVIYMNGVFRRWDIETWKPVAEYNFISANENSASFTADGLLAATPGQALPTGSNGYNIWNTWTGERVDCWGPHCPGGEPYDARFIDTGLFLDPKGRWLVHYSEISGTAIALQTNQWGSISIPGNGLGPSIKRLVFDLAGRYAAYALDDGSVRVYEVEPFLHLEEGDWRARRLEYSQSQLQDRIKALVFDDTRTWLALLTDGELTVWNLSNIIFSGRFQRPARDANVIAFDRMGSMLALGTAGAIQIIDLEEKELISEPKAQDVEFLYFTLDNRALMYGDGNGQIHILGVP